MNAEQQKKALVTALNTVVPDLHPWLEARVRQGRSQYQIQQEFKALLAGMASSGAPSGTALTDEDLIGELHARLTGHRGDGAFRAAAPRMVHPADLSRGPASSGTGSREGGTDPTLQLSLENP